MAVVACRAYRSLIRGESRFGPAPVDDPSLLGSTTSISEQRI
jgi:hypothetical protein